MKTICFAMLHAYAGRCRAELIAFAANAVCHLIVHEGPCHSATAALGFHVRARRVAVYRQSAQTSAAVNGITARRTSITSAANAAITALFCHTASRSRQHCMGRRG